MQNVTKSYIPKLSPSKFQAKNNNLGARNDNLDHPDEQHPPKVCGNDLLHGSLHTLTTLQDKMLTYHGIMYQY